MFKYFYKLVIILLFNFISLKGNSQNKNSREASSLFFVPEFAIGKTQEANTYFPKTSLQKNIFLSLGFYSFNWDKKWAKQLNFPKTGLCLGYTDLGNLDKIGRAFSITPFIEFELLNNLDLNIAFGGSYIDTQYNKNTNPFNRAVSTKINWSFKTFLYYNIFKEWRAGLGYLHHSNGHTSLPNQGLNSFVLSVSKKINVKPPIKSLIDQKNTDNKSKTYISFRYGMGQNALSPKFNSKKEVYNVSADIGKIINNTFKFGGGFYYRFYEHYYDYIKNNEELVEQQFPHFRDNPYSYATNFGLFATSEVLLNHVGLEFDIGVNIFKPFYKIDWQLNSGYYTDENGNTIETLGKLDWYYEIKRTISSRMGLKYYIFATENLPKHNIYIGAHINANLGQADFSELSIGYTYIFNQSEK